ncbi:lytic transglycosylase domain-containing protein [Frankia sp. AgB1.9]|uniref:lytic transglycosylase domain-containing protein n=1 Tax=unclassified Frankia TaxID=2632575 RepID=UPI001933095F|nr:MULTISPECIES: lytic transglycosylase domain-containing protein [unclassified Frankia]MBL7491402.1 lytic transglycosylase domain-containing protein [Frankia sp. AgW1.1]MBL7551316.1 lytic transglycosylase domain-containing protein [Frankia sp. AgB1.9]MBL7624916.1 lytic transglycosylase domain-containing protein [Frankia sp. AgB1.8]
MSRQRTRQAPVLAAGLVTVLVALLGACSQVLPMRSSSLIPTDLIPAFRAAATTYGLLSAAQLAAQARVESRFDSSVVSRAGAVGMMQFLPKTWAEFGIDGDGDGVADPLDPLDAIPSAARYEQHLAGLVGHLPGDRVALVLAAYNAGPSAVQAAGGVPDYAETRTYIARVNEWAATFATEV